MKIHCSYCEALIDTDKHSICPVCGAEINQKELQDNLKQEQKKKELELDEKEADIVRRQLENKRIEQRLKREKKNESATRILRIGCMIPILLVVGIFCLMLILSAKNVINNETETEPTETIYIEPYHEAKFEEVVHTKNYDVVLDEWKYFEPLSYAKQSGMKYLAVHFTITNISEQEILSDEPIYCYDENGKQCQKVVSLFDEDKSLKLEKQWIQSGKMLKGWYYFEVPENMNYFEIMYGDKIEVELILN